MVKNGECESIFEFKNNEQEAICIKPKENSSCKIKIKKKKIVKPKTTPRK